MMSKIYRTDSETFQYTTIRHDVLNANHVLWTEFRHSLYHISLEESNTFVFINILSVLNITS